MSWVWIVLGLGFVFCGYFLWRNQKVWIFILEINRMCYEYNIRHQIQPNTDADAWQWFMMKYTYEGFLYSFKPLRLDVWYTPEEIKKIKSQI